MTVLPMLPAPAPFRAIAHVAASEAERLHACPLRFAFDHDAALRRLQPYASAALLGTAAHAALAALIRSHTSGVLSGGEEETRAAARSVFDRALAQECSKRDAAIAERGALPGDSTEEPPALPFYSLTRARLARFAAQRFGERWLWREPVLAVRGAGRSNVAGDRALRAVEAELQLRSADGLVVGVTDSVDRSGGGPIIEEFKSGEPSPARLESWRQQLLIYAQLYREQYGAAPAGLRVHSLAGGTHDYACAEAEAAAAVERARAALQELNRQIAAGVSAAGLARPSDVACSQCPHRPWCEPYWRAGAPGSNGADIEGAVIRTDGWQADIELAVGGTVRADLKASRVAPPSGARIRICGARSDATGSLQCGRTTSIWRVRA